MHSAFFNLIATNTHSHTMMAIHALHMHAQSVGFPIANCTSCFNCLKSGPVYVQVYGLPHTCADLAY